MLDELTRNDTVKLALKVNRMSVPSNDVIFRLQLLDLVLRIVEAKHRFGTRVEFPVEPILRG